MTSSSPPGDKAQPADDILGAIRVRANSVVGVLDLLLLTELAPKQKQYTELARTSGKEILEMLDRVFNKNPPVRETHDVEDEVLDEDVVRKPRLVELFFQHIPKYLDALEQAIANRDAKSVEYQAHKTKGSCLAFGAPRMVKQCQRIEMAGREGELESTPEHFGLLRQEFDKVHHQIFFQESE